MRTGIVAVDATRARTRPGLDRAPSGRGFAVDDRRDAALDRMDRSFVAASPRMLGFLREPGRFARLGVELCEIDRNLAHLSSPQLHDYLAERDLLPARERVGMAAAP